MIVNGTVLSGEGKPLKLGVYSQHRYRRKSDIRREILLLKYFFPINFNHALVLEILVVLFRFYVALYPG